MTMFPSIPATDGPGSTSRKYLDPGEKVVKFTRFHWAQLLQPVALIVAGVFVTIAVDVTQPVKTGSAFNVAWLLWGLWVLWVVATIWDIRKMVALRKANARTQLLAAVIVAAIAYGIAWLVQNKRFGVGGMLLVVLLVVIGWALIQVGEWADRFYRGHQQADRGHRGHHREDRAHDADRQADRTWRTGRRRRGRRWDTACSTSSRPARTSR